MFDARRVGQQHKPGHPRLQDNRIRRIKPQHNPLPHAIHCDNLPPHRTSAKYIHSRRDQDRFAPATGPLYTEYAATRNSCDAAAHGFNFWKFRHVAAFRVSVEQPTAMYASTVGCL